MGILAFCGGSGKGLKKPAAFLAWKFCQRANYSFFTFFCRW